MTGEEDNGGLHSQGKIRNRNSGLRQYSEAWNTVPAVRTVIDQRKQSLRYKCVYKMRHEKQLLQKRRR